MSGDTALVLVGHGTTGRSDPAFLLLWKEILSCLPRTYLVMLHGSPSLEELLLGLKREQIRRVLLFPLLLSPASHLQRDIASPDSVLQRRLTGAGLEVSLLGGGLLLEEELRRLLCELCLERVRGEEEKESS